MAIIKWLIALLLLCSCSPKIVTVTEYKERYHTLYERDSVFVKDSIYNKIFVKGDTVFDTKTIYLYRYRDVIKSDTTVIRDSIPYPVEVFKEVNVLSWWQQTQIKLFWILSAIFAGWILFKKRKILTRLLIK